ncbi:vitellogenin receptor isoform X2 [Anthonomus grandis grandis]|uniref:vitellogenin receptor isoform X2 n=1 Tax=Anthonomus grandis grandis TaxID=2921223 RepID=UPI002165E96A|nr:vitellogenin receptor isoform X2 [Anthonomus grandis grandis]
MMLHAVLLLAGTVVYCSSSSAALLCSGDDFRCENNICVPAHAHCDGKNDCGDFSDEHNCDVLACKPPAFFKCKNQRCISASFRCDKENDCEDFSDETDCDYFKVEHIAVNTTCEKGEWQCTDKLCIPEEWVCNEEIDCLDGSDESVGCTTQSDHVCDGFKCKNQRCIPSEWRCDGNDDCSDNSDEIDCEHHFDLKNCTLDNQKYLCLDGKACIGIHQVCDGQNECLDKSDEGALCSHSTLNCAFKNCSHECLQLPTGPKCICPQNYHNVDEKTCQDINECEEYGICDQKCRNLPGSYECYCDHKYVLQEDKKTCKAVGSEATMIFSSKTQIRSYLLTSNLLFPVASNLKQVVGVSIDSNHIYWTDVHSEHESIVRALEDGSNRDVIVTSGLGLPEDLKVDWLTGNIYFTDTQKQHIGVCKNDGSHCMVIINKDIRKPRALVLNVDEGVMYWSDWESPAEIATAQMDGTNPRPFLRDDIYWPNGLALDYPNERLYWTDAKKNTLESIRLDGTDRRVILEKIVKHPFAISVFENRLYWSDWNTHSIDSCDKFTGKHHRTLIKEKKDFIYGISIYHSALHNRMDNPCALAFCTDICLLKGLTYTCACSEGRMLSADKHTCHSIEKKQMLVVAAKNILLSVEHKNLGKHMITMLTSVVSEAGALTYNSRNNSIFISDLLTGNIVQLNLHNSEHNILPVVGAKSVVSMDYDPTGNNIYFCDQAKGTLEVFSLTTMTQKVLIHDSDSEVPQSVAVVPHEGVMFVSFFDKIKDESHIDRMAMDGTGRTHVIEKGLLGPVYLHYDSEYHRVYFVDSSTGIIEHSSVDGDERHIFKGVRSSVSDITTLSSDLFWTTSFSNKLFWASKSFGDNTQKIALGLPDDAHKIHLASVTPRNHVTSPCQHKNGNCSHICLSTFKTVVCACPTRMELDTDRKTCIHRHLCDVYEFSCSQSNTCILNTLKCDGKKDCPMGEDEEHCKKEIKCPNGFFGCSDGQCISEKQVCDHHFDCRDRSDELECHNKLSTQSICPPHEFTCADNINCIDLKSVCDGFNDCLDNSDEINCLTNVCQDNQFRCDSGQCIPKGWECDHEYDCKDLSDEHSECSITCKSHMFTCKNGKCIHKSLLCDHSDDCGDESDEVDCSSSVDGDCPVGQIPCSSNNSSICFSHEAKCNGTAECPEGEDERNCNNCGAELFECSNKKCISSTWVCDGTDDCGDHSDESEEMCRNKTAKATLFSRFSHVPCDDGFRCKNGACISLKLLCDEKNDCYDESDEGSFCSKSCEQMNNPCQQECIRTPSGPMCRCKEGYRLMGDGYSCKDINECELDPPVCSQLCRNIEGGVSCLCYENYSLRSDKKSCKSLGEPLILLYTVDNQIREINQKTNSLRVVYSEEMPKITDLDVSLREHSVVFTIENSPTIQKLNIISMKRHYIEHIGYPRKIAYDWSTGNIYFYNSVSDEKSISVCSFDSMSCAKLIDIDIHRHVSELVVDSENRVLFYSLTSWWVFNSPSYVLYKAYLDGSGVTEIVKSTNGYVSGLTYDLNKKQLYYADQHAGNIVSLTYEGTQWQVLFPNLTHPASLKFFENTLYFATSGGDISKCLLYGSKSCSSFRISAHNYELFTVVQETLQPTLPNVCENNTCSFLCVASSTRYSCLCEDGTIVEDNEKCDKKPQGKGKKAVKFHSVNHGTDSLEVERDSSKAVVAVLLVSLGIALMGAGLMWYARKKRNSSLIMSMRMRFNTRSENLDNKSSSLLVPGQHEYTNPIPELPNNETKDIERRDSFVMEYEVNGNHINNIS